MRDALGRHTALDTCSRPSPCSFRGRTLQYVGRVLRAHGDKIDLAVHDYVDALSPVLKAMHGQAPTVIRHTRLRHYFNALTGCVKDLDAQNAGLLRRIRPDLTSEQARCVAVAYRKNGGLKEAVLSNGSDASNQIIDRALISASATCKVSPPVSVS